MIAWSSCSAPGNGTRRILDRADPAGQRIGNRDSGNEGAVPSCAVGGELAIPAAAQGKKMAVRETRAQRGCGLSGTPTGVPGGGVSGREVSATDHCSRARQRVAAFAVGGSFSAATIWRTASRSSNMASWPPGTAMTLAPLEVRKLTSCALSRPTDMSSLPWT